MSVEATKPKADPATGLPEGNPPETSSPPAIDPNLFRRALPPTPGNASAAKSAAPKEAEAASGSEDSAAAALEAPASPKPEVEDPESGGRLSMADMAAYWNAHDSQKESSADKPAPSSAASGKKSRPTSPPPKAGTVRGYSKKGGGGRGHLPRQSEYSMLWERGYDAEQTAKNQDGSSSAAPPEDDKKTHRVAASVSLNRGRPMSSSGGNQDWRRYTFRRVSTNNKGKPQQDD